MNRVSRSIAQQLLDAELAINNTLASPTILAAVGTYGYTATRMQTAKALFQEALELTEKQKKEYGDQYEATAGVQRAWDEAAVASTAIASTKSPARKRPLTKTSPLVFVPVTVISGSTLSVEVRCPSGHVVLLSSCDVASLTSLLAAMTRPERETRSC